LTLIVAAGAFFVVQRRRLGYNNLGWRPILIRMPRLRGLLFDVGGTLVPNEFASSKEGFEQLCLARLTNEFGSELPWFRALVGHEFSANDMDPDTLRQNVGADVAGFLRTLGVRVSPDEVMRPRRLLVNRFSDRARHRGPTTMVARIRDSQRGMPARPWTRGMTWSTLGASVSPTSVEGMASAHSGQIQGGDGRLGEISQCGAERIAGEWLSMSVYEVDDSGTRDWSEAAVVGLLHHQQNRIAWQQHRGNVNLLQNRAALGGRRWSPSLMQDQDLCWLTLKGPAYVKRNGGSPEPLTFDRFEFGLSDGTNHYHRALLDRLN
jgi:hypothetical protein